MVSFATNRLQLMQVITL